MQEKLEKPFFPSHIGQVKSYIKTENKLSNFTLTCKWSSFLWWAFGITSDQAKKSLLG